MVAPKNIGFIDIDAVNDPMAPANPFVATSSPNTPIAVAIDVPFNAIRPLLSNVKPTTITPVCNAHCENELFTSLSKVITNPFNKSIPFFIESAFIKLFQNNCIELDNCLDFPSILFKYFSLSAIAEPALLVAETIAPSTFSQFSIILTKTLF